MWLPVLACLQWLFSPTSSDNANRLLVEGQQLYLTLFAVCHLLGCVWYFITKEERENYQVGHPAARTRAGH